MKTGYAIGPLMKLILTRTALRSDELLKVPENSRACVARCLLLLRLLAASRAVVASEADRETAEVYCPCLRLRCDGS